MSKDRDDPVLRALEIGVFHTRNRIDDVGRWSDAEFIEKAIAIQKQQAKVIEAANTFREHGSGINGCYLNELWEELAALDELLSGEKV